MLSPPKVFTPLEIIALFSSKKTLFLLKNKEYCSCIFAIRYSFVILLIRIDLLILFKIGHKPLAVNRIFGIQEEISVGLFVSVCLLQGPSLGAELTCDAFGAVSDGVIH